MCCDLFSAVGQVVRGETPHVSLPTTVYRPREVSSAQVTYPMWAAVCSRGLSLRAGSPGAEGGPQLGSSPPIPPAHCAVVFIRARTMGASCADSSLARASRRSIVMEPRSTFASYPG